MLTLLFFAAVLFVTFKLLVWGVKAAWGITKVLCSIILFPAIVICLFLWGFVYVAIIALVIVGIGSLFSRVLE